MRKEDPRIRLSLEQLIKDASMRKEKKNLCTISVRVPRETATLLREEADGLKLELSQHLRTVLQSHTGQQDVLDLRERGEKLERMVRDLAKDLEVAVRLFLVSLKLSSEEEAESWCRENLSGGDGARCSQ